jgi:hypothetical protein
MNKHNHETKDRKLKRNLFGKLGATLTVAALTFAGNVGATVLTFDGPICAGVACADFNFIDANYGSSTSIAVAYEFGDTALTPKLAWWDTDYSDLTNVAWGAPGGTPKIFLQPLGGASVTLNGFDLGSWPHFANNTQVTIVDGLNNILFSSGQISISGVSHTHFSGPYTSTTGIGIQFGPDGYNVGIDNIDFSVSGGTVPEPATLGMLLLGLAGLGFVGLGRKKGNAIPFAA